MTNKKNYTVKFAKSATLDRERIGRKLRAIREQQKMDAKTLADNAGVDRANLSRIEAGKYSVGLDILSNLALQLGYMVDLVPLVSEQSEDSDKLQGVVKYNSIDFSNMIPDPYYDYQSHWVDENILMQLGIDISKCTDYDKDRITKEFTFNRSVYFGNSRCVFNYGHMLGTMILRDLRAERELSRKDADLILGVCNAVSCFITDEYAEKAESIYMTNDELYKAMVNEVTNDFVTPALKWMYQNGYAQKECDLLNTAAKSAVFFRLCNSTIEYLIDYMYYDPVEEIDIHPENYECKIFASINR